MLYLLTAVCFAIRAIPRLLVPNAYSSDTYFHLFCARVYRNNRFHIPRRLPRVLLGHQVTYPPLYHFLLALFPERIRLWAERLTGATFDSINVVIIGVYCRWLAGSLGLHAPESIGLWCAALYAFSPALLRQGIGPRAFNGSPRVMGQTLYLAHATLAHVGLANGDPLILVGSALMGGLLILTAKFGTQVLVFFAPLIVILVSPVYLVPVAGSLAAALLLSRGHALRVLQGQVRHSVFYFKYLQRVFLYPNARRIGKYLSNVTRIPERLVRGRIRALAQWFNSERHSLHILAIAFPQVLVALATIIVASPEIDAFSKAWLISAVICFLITNYRRLLFLGEPERYLEYAIVPATFIPVAMFVEAGWEYVLTACLLFSCVAAIRHACTLVICNRGRERQHQDTIRACTALNHLPRGRVLPIGSYHWAGLFLTRHDILTHGCNLDQRLLSKNEFMLVCGNYPFPSAQFNEILKRYQIDYVLTGPEHLKAYTTQVLTNEHEFHRHVDVLHETATLLIFKVDQAEVNIPPSDDVRSSSQAA